MVFGPVFDTVHDAYVAVLRAILTDPQYRTAGRRTTALEVVGTSFTVRDPLARTPWLATRRINIVFHYAEALWYLAGRDDAAMIGYYAPRLHTLATPEGRLTGTAYGPRLFRPARPDERSVFDRTLATLRADPDSKRAAMPIMRPDELVDVANPDVACTLGLQVLLRDGALHAVAYLRGNDAMIGLACDTFSFTLIQEYAARQLGVPVGSYTHHVGSMHINMSDVDRVRAMLAEADTAHPRPRFEPVPMPATTSADLAEVMRVEQALRTNQLVLTPHTGLKLPAYWRQVLALFEVYRQIVHQPDTPIDRVGWGMLSAAHRWLVAARWPDRIPDPARTGSGSPA